MDIFMKMKWMVGLGFFLISGLVSVSWSAGEEGINLLSLLEGTIPVVTPGSYSGWYAENLLDDSPESGWACESGNIRDNVYIFEMPEAGTIERFEFDNAAVDAEGAGAKDVLVEISGTSERMGFSPVLEASLQDRRNGQSFPAAQKISGRWVRLTIKTNQGSAKWCELFSFRGFGPKPPPSAPANISGTYATSYSNFHVRQHGTALSGCYEFDGGLLDGAIEGRVMKITWRESGGPDDRGPAVMVFSADGKWFRGF